MWEFATADPNITQQLAALTAVVAVAIIGVAFLIISPTWKGFGNTYAFLSTSEKRLIIRNTLLYFGPFLILFFVTDFFGVYAPALAPTAARSIFLLFLAILIIYLLISQIIRWIRKTQPSPGMEILPFLYTFTLFCVALCILFCSVALFGVSNTMLNIEIGPFNQDNYNWARWFLVDGITFFILGIISFAYTLVCQKIGVKKQSDNVERNKTRVGRNVSFVVVFCLLLALLLLIPKQYENSGSEFIKDLISIPLNIKGPVSVNNQQFTTKNESNFDWKDITFNINKNGLSSGYSLGHDYLKQGETLTIEITEFANNEGIRFNPLTMKPLNLTIDLHDSLGRQGRAFCVLKKTGQ